MSSRWHVHTQPPMLLAPRPVPPHCQAGPYLPGVCSLGCASASGWQRVSSIRTPLLPYTVFIFLHKNMQAVCLQMLEAQNIPFVCRETDGMACFQSDYEMQPGSLEGGGEEWPPVLFLRRSLRAGMLGPPSRPWEGSGRTCSLRTGDRILSEKKKGNCQERSFLSLGTGRATWRMLYPIDLLWVSRHESFWFPNGNGLFPPINYKSNK